MPETSYSDLRVSYMLTGNAARAAEAVHMTHATLEARIGDTFPGINNLEMMKKALGLYSAELQSKFQTGVDGILDALGYTKPATQVLRGQDGAFHAIQSVPFLFSVVMSARSGVDYMLEVPAGFDGQHFEPIGATRLTSHDFINGGMGNFGIRHYGALIQPALVEIPGLQTTLPPNFDPEKHSWLQLDNSPTRFDGPKPTMVHA